MDYRLGIDVGSTTVKVALLGADDKLRFKRYRRHNARVGEILAGIFEELRAELPELRVRAAITGSAGLGIAQRAGIPFIQEVISSTAAVDRYLPGTDAVVELGGEDAKIIFFGRISEQRMNGTCAGGTGAFIDQMATLMDVSVEELNALAAKHQKIYPIASRCGVFAKSDIQPLLNQGARREDVAASILQAVVDQTIGGLAQGRKIEGQVAFLGGPLAFLSELRVRFVETLGLREDEAKFPEDAEYFVAMGCALEAGEIPLCGLDELVEKLSALEEHVAESEIRPLFGSEAEYEQFKARHAASKVIYRDPSGYEGDAFLGIDAGSTTIKLVLMSREKEILYSYYAPSKGSPVAVLLEELKKIRALCGARIHIAGSCVTGYGEELMVNAFGADAGIVETVAHYTAAKFFDPSVDYIIDIGGQDMKCFRVRRNAIDSIMLNEACSSGCGSFIETFAKAIGHSTEDFARLGLFSKHPADLGSRCTVFMNSSVKQAQKEGATVEDISAGLSISVVKNALYKVIRVVDPAELGEHIVVQGGTFLNDAILRAFELELGTTVTRPAIAGLMGAFGCALYAMEAGMGDSTLLSAEELEHFTHEATGATCGLCGNNCALTVNRFSGGRRYITGNKCERGAGKGKAGTELPNLYEYKYKRLTELPRAENPARGVVGIPLVLNFFDALPFWCEFFRQLGIRVELSARSSRELYQLGQDTIPSDTVCYPAKLVHGHIADLAARGIDKIFYPCAPYNFEEYDKADNYYNCPVVAYYPELIAANMPQAKTLAFINPYLVVNKRSFEKKVLEALEPHFPGLTPREVRRATKLARATDAAFREDLEDKGKLALQYAKSHGLKAIVLAGRPYHIDPEVNHGIDKLLSSHGLVVLSEEAVAHLGRAPGLKVLNQWTYHSRLYNAAAFAGGERDVELIHLVSFGCGIDAITGDEVRAVLESRGKYYTQIKIDEVTNLGAARIRVRSLIAAMEARERGEAQYGTA